jgi:tRNA modification GTPase
MSRLPDPADLIVAAASAPGSGGRGIVRLSGPPLRNALKGLFGEAFVADWPRRATTRAGELVNVPGARADVSIWPDGRSYTGQPLAELHVPGAPALMEAIVAAACRHGARPAVRGEFTLRAVLAGKMDLARAEAVLGVVDAESPDELRVALAQLGGGVGQELTRVRSDLLDLLADLEAGLDFAHEDLSFVDDETLQRRIESAEQSLADLASRAAGGLRATALPRVVLAGPPNAGKSTLFNALAGRDAALVSDVRGTTRDWLSVEIDLGGRRVELIDTAGADDATATGIEAAAQRARLAESLRADLLVWCVPVDGEDDETAPPPTVADRTVRVLTKCELKATDGETREPVRISVHAGVGLDLLRDRIRARLSSHERSGGTAVLLAETAERWRPALAGAGEALLAARDLAGTTYDQTLIAAELRRALDFVGEVIGGADTEEVLGRVFQRFCIGK